MATRTAIRTVAAPARPMIVRKGMPVMARAARAMTTVAPAKTTALPAVAVARAIDSSQSVPGSASCSRCREMTKSA